MRTVSPLYLPARRAVGSGEGILSCIPGSAVRGALLSAVNNTTGEQEEHETTALDFLSCSALLPLGQFEKGNPVIAPRSCVTCANQPGPRHSGGHGLHDRLFAAEIQRLLVEAQQLVAGSQFSSPRIAQDVRCPHCSPRSPGLLSAWNGMLVLEGDSARAVAPSVVTAVQHAPPQAHESPSLTVRQTLAKGQVFQGTVRIREEELSQQLTRICAEGNHLWVGADRGHGFGEIIVEQWRNSEHERSVADRISAFNAHIQQLAITVNLPVPDGVRYVGVLALDAIALSDDFGRQLTSLDGAAWADLLGLPADGVQVRSAWEAVTVVRGWNSRRGLPLSESIALAAGSVWLLRVTSVSEEELVSRLAFIEDAGIGARRADGLGRVSFCHDIHGVLTELSGAGVARADPAQLQEVSNA
ncbi:MAG: hypothetical protein M1118_13320 [Chloroflexi bacterium]|nr:hypothetical protein [Chloroflexota bacterium]